MVGGDKLKKYNIPIRPRGGGIYLVDLSGEKFGEWTVVRKGKKKHQTMWVVRCSCGNVREIQKGSLLRGTSTSCGNCKEHYAWKGCGELSGQYWESLKKRASKRNIEFNITIEFAWDVYMAQNRKCKLSGLPIHFARNYSCNNLGGQTASLDRIDSTMGYVEDNVQWVHKLVNVMKWDMPDDYFINVCHIISDFHRDDSNSNVDQLEKYK